MTRHLKLHQQPHSVVPSLLDLVQPLLRVLHVNLVAQDARAEGLGTANGHARAGEGRPLADAAADRRVDAHPLAATAADTRATLIACACLISDAIEHDVVIVYGLDIVLNVIHAGIDTET